MRRIRQLLVTWPISSPRISTLRPVSFCPRPVSTILHGLTPFELLIRQPVQFPLYFSSTRLTDRPGEMVTVETEQMTALPPIRTVLRSGKKKGEADSIPIHLHARLT